MGQHIINFRLYGHTFYNTNYRATHYTLQAIRSILFITDYTAANYTIQAIRQHVMQYMQYSSAMNITGYTAALLNNTG
jgi:hypothetical protein